MLGRTICVSLTNAIGAPRAWTKCETAAEVVAGEVGVAEDAAVDLMMARPVDLTMVPRVVALGVLLVDATAAGAGVEAEVGRPGGVVRAHHPLEAVQTHLHLWPALLVVLLDAVLRDPVPRRGTDAGLLRWMHRNAGEGHQVVPGPVHRRLAAVHGHHLLHHHPENAAAGQVVAHHHQDGAGILVRLLGL